ncbi:hypothetical protein HanIR_Chr14g0673031 [Helianthus annuus]|nr:hypothetical protein HanIR_Chr14g0673031 [Helianthus annuus]
MGTMFRFVHSSTLFILLETSVGVRCGAVTLPLKKSLKGSRFPNGSLSSRDGALLLVFRYKVIRGSERWRGFHGQNLSFDNRELVIESHQKFIEPFLLS